MVHIITLIFLAGMGYAEFRIMQMEIETIEQRLDKKIKIINALEERIDYLEDKINQNGKYYIFVLAAICNAIMDKINFHWDDSIFKGSRFEQWANPAVSYRNKWKNHSNSLGGERFPGSSTIFVWTTDLWHFAQSFMLSLIHI